MSHDVAAIAALFDIYRAAHEPWQDMTIEVAINE